MADRQGLRLEKSRQRDPRGLTHGTYQLVHASSNTLFASGGDAHGYGLDLNEIEKALTRKDPK